MTWEKPYRPPRNQRLAPELYTHAARVYFMTIRAYRNKSPFVQDDLNELIPDRKGHVVIDARDINAHGQIIGIAQRLRDDSRSIVVLTPATEPLVRSRN